jgi:formate hydrogenlyase subunit 3/multisubunit Na+/H+ antiporter MnhD subunit
MCNQLIYGMIIIGFLELIFIVFSVCFCVRFSEKQFWINRRSKIYYCKQVRKFIIIGFVFSTIILSVFFLILASLLINSSKCNSIDNSLSQIHSVLAERLPDSTSQSKIVDAIESLSSKIIPEDSIYYSKAIHLAQIHKILMERFPDTTMQLRFLKAINDLRQPTHKERPFSSLTIVLQLLFISLGMALIIYSIRYMNLKPKAVSPLLTLTLGTLFTLIGTISIFSISEFKLIHIDKFIS